MVSRASRTGSLVGARTRRSSCSSTRPSSRPLLTSSSQSRLADAFTCPATSRPSSTLVLGRVHYPDWKD